MKGSTSSTLEVQQLQKHLNTATAELKHAQQEHDEKFKVLLGFVSQLSFACKGQNLELDNKLAKLRRLLPHSESFSDAVQSICEVEKILKSQYRHITIQLNESRHGLSRVVAQLQRVKELPEKTKRELSYFKQELAKPFHTVWDYIPKIKQLIEHYEQVLELQFSDAKYLELESKHKVLADELLSLIDDIVFLPENHDKVCTVQAVLSNDLSVNSLLSAYQAILTLVVENLLHEKSSAQEFLVALNETLSAVGDITTTMQTQSDKNESDKARLNSTIQNHVDNVDLSLHVLNDAEELKSQVRHQLHELRRTLAQKEELEQRERQQLHLSIQTMEQQLSSLTSEVGDYKEKLFEQQKSNLTDSLTQLPNRAALEDRMAFEHQKLQKNNNSLWVVVADIDHFKSINDNFGHSIGDKTLQVIAKALKSSIRDTEFIARYGGEEFVLLLPHVLEPDIEAILNRVRERIKSIPFKFKNKRITVTISIGAAKVHKKERIEDTFDRADAALYRAKDQNRDRVVVDS
ncbi:diguanylate cyclase [Shewanella sp. 202IG2-18]|uniref:GGDEF domain-containing protein n=1 Tax=Parashewanella hymeniacidonis TaxID=2807618 RepID=UPI00195F9884|nr:GGDEF domain-containing protein [Parashewanella hymeniacidonis]MBM7071007.1 diguanylate cyclase [Parashewanella hymeniacidonis]